MCTFLFSANILFIFLVAEQVEGGVYSVGGLDARAVVRAHRHRHGEIETGGQRLWEAVLRRQGRVGLGVRGPTTAPGLGGEPGHRQGRGRRGGYKGVVAFVDELEKDVHALREPEESIIGTMIVSVKY
jgi:hypothetical protein